VVPFHPLRHEARVRAARALASVCTFGAIAVVLLGGSAGGPLANAEAGAPAEPVLATPAEAVQAAPPPELAPPVEEPLPPPVEEPAPPPVEEPPVEQPPVEEPPVEEPPVDQPPPGGGGKDVPGDPVEPETPPTPSDPETPDPGSAPSGSDDFGRPGVDSGTSAPSGAGKPSADVVDQAPAGLGTTDGGQTTDTAPASNDGTTPQLPSSNPAELPSQGTLDNEAPARGQRGGSASGLGGSGTTSPDTGFGIGAPGGTGGGATLGASADAAALSVAAIVPGADDDGDGDGGSGSGDGSGNENVSNDNPSGAEAEPFGPVFGSVPELLEFVPDSFKIVLAGLAALTILLALGYLLSALRNRRLERQRSELLKEVGLLQTALLPPVPDRMGALRTSVAYRPADGPGAGGDFYDVLPLAGGRVGFILGDVSGHGRGALARTAFMRYTLRAYLEAGLEPRVALQVAGRVIDENLGGDFATVLLAVHDPETGSLTYASAGHPAPIVVGPQPHEPVTAGSSPPIGVGVKTGLRQTTVPLVPGAVAALFTDGLMEARVDGGMLGRERLEELLAELGTGATASGLISSVSDEARVLSDDIAAVVIQPTTAATAGLFRTEQLELSSRELDGPVASNFLESCGFSTVEIEAAIYDARALAERFGGVILHVVFGNRLRVEVLPRNVESIEAASRRAAATR
jgi:Stage II sporulation protein E (SpoIIE)